MKAAGTVFAWPVVLLLIACGGRGGGAAPTVEVRHQSDAATRTPGRAGDPGVTVGAVVQACREKDPERLRGFISVPVSDEDIERMWAGGSDVQLLTQTVPEIAGDRTTIDVSLRVTRADGQATVERTWDLVRDADAVWRLTALPECF